MKAPLKSRLFECAVMHARFAPRAHRFVHRIFLLSLDLDELPALAAQRGALRINRRGLFSFSERDYLPDEPGLRSARDASLKVRLLERLAARGVTLPAQTRVELVTMPRVAGYLFNPVSFYFCRDEAGRPLACVVEVTNTFREVKLYVLPPDAWSDGAFRLRVPKHFYVSPFSDVDVAFDFILRPPNGSLRLQIDDYTGGARTLTSTMTGRARPWSQLRLAWFALKYPLLTVKVIALIHAHAALLYLKKVPWFAKAARRADQRDVLRPHASLS